MERIFVFLRSPGAATTVLLGATLIALIVANSPMATQYMSLVNLQLGPLTTMEWVNDALMAIFFLFVGLEVKRELVSGELNTNAKRIMPGVAALFGVLIPAFIYYLIAGFDPEYIHGCHGYCFCNWGYHCIRITSSKFYEGFLNRFGSY